MDLPLEETDCLLCGGRSRTPVIEAPDPDAPEGPRFAVVRCEACGLCFTSPRPREADMARFYPADYRPHRAAGRVRRAASHASGTRGWRPASRVLRLFGRGSPERRWLAPHGRMRLLDVGCGGGSFLARMQAQGWQATGLDASEAAVARVREELALPALLGTLPHADLRPGSFDAVTFWQSLEHLHQPLEALRHARGLLAPGGKVYVSVPSIEGLAFRWFGAAWTGLELPRHLTHFAPATLAEMLRRAGLGPGPVRFVRHPSWLVRSARLARQRGLGLRRLHLLRFRPLARLAAEYCALRGQGDCIMTAAGVS